MTFATWQNRRGLTFSLSSRNLIIVSFSLLMWLIPTLSLIISSFLWHHHCTNGQENYFILGLLSNHHSLKEKTRNQSCNLIFLGAQILLSFPSKANVCVSVGGGCLSCLPNVKLRIMIGVKTGDNTTSSLQHYHPSSLHPPPLTLHQQFQIVIQYQ